MKIIVRMYVKIWVRLHQPFLMFASIMSFPAIISSIMETPVVCITYTCMHVWRIIFTLLCVSMCEVYFRMFWSPLSSVASSCWTYTVFKVVGRPSILPALSWMNACVYIWIYSYVKHPIEWWPNLIRYWWAAWSCPHRSCPSDRSDGLCPVANSYYVAKSFPLNTYIHTHLVFHIPTMDHSHLQYIHRNAHIQKN